MKIIAFYLPQFHAIPENDEWWGEGFTEWTNVKKAKPLFKGHNQPRVPQNGKYYNLLDDEVKRWQINLAKENGIYGFCFYHYWFDGHLLLEKPVEQFLDNKSLDFPFCLSWANSPWSKTWVSRSDQVLIDQEYDGKERWKAHFDYLLPFFKDKRYIKNNGKPLYVIYEPGQIECIEDMLNYWQELSIKEGFPGIEFAYQYYQSGNTDKKIRELFDYDIEFQPIYSLQEPVTNTKKLGGKFLRKLDNAAYQITGRKLSEVLIQNVRKHDYDEVWSAVLQREPKDSKSVPGVFVDWDNTSRRTNGGRVFTGGSPEKFEEYLTTQIQRTRELYKKDFMFLTAWNEWCEGSYLEPDDKYGDAYLRAVKNALNQTEEFPSYRNEE